MTIASHEAQEVLARSKEIVTAETVQRSLDKMATEITAKLGEDDPVILVVMNGAIIPAGRLLSRLSFAFQIGYLHATRYTGKTVGNEVKWIAQPSVAVDGRTVLVIDDIFDEGTTLKAIVDELAPKAKHLYTATLVNKVHDRKVPNFIVDFIGLDVPDAYVFGCGMDYHEYWRNLPGIWALND